MYYLFKINNPEYLNIYRYCMSDEFKMNKNIEKVEV